MKKNVNNNSNSNIDDHSINIHCPIKIFPTPNKKSLCDSYKYEKSRTFRQVLDDVARGADSLDDVPDASSYSISTPDLAENIDMDIPVTLYFSKRIFGCAANLQRFVDRLGGILGVDTSEKSDVSTVPIVNQTSDTVVDNPTSSPTSDVPQ